MISAVPTVVTEVGAQVGAPVFVVQTWLGIALLVVAWLVPMALMLVFSIMLIRRERRGLMPEKARALLVRAEEQAHAIVADATHEARQVRAAIEEERLRAVHEDHSELDRFFEAYSTKLNTVLKELSYELEKEHMRASTGFIKSLQTIEARVAGDADEAKHSMDSFTSQSSALFERLASEIENVEKGIQHLAIALEEAAQDESGKNAELVRKEMQKIGQETALAVTEVAKGLDAALRQSVEKEFAAIGKEIDKYRAARMELVDERILVLIEETAQIALGKQVSMADQAEFVYRALEEAKERGVFV